VLGDPTDLAGPGSTADASGWVPAHGAEPLHQRWRAWLRRRYGTAASLAAAWNTPMTSIDDPNLRLPAVRPPGARGDAWQRFVERDLGFTYGVATAADEPLYREFLAERHGQPADVNAAYGLTGASRLATFADVRARIWDGMLAHSLPASGPMLRDWIAFASTVLPLRRAAHRFTVLVPVVPGDSPDEQRRKRELAERVAAIEKPAHTAFDVRLYWGMFRAGEARLGLDTVLGPGSRSTAIVLGESLIGAGHLSHPDAARAPGRATYADETLRAASPAACCTRA
jgi:hypothetical protein